MPTVVFEPTIPASERPQTHALDSTATGIGQFQGNRKWHLSAPYWWAHLICFMFTVYHKSRPSFFLQGIIYCHKRNENMSGATTRLNKKTVKYWDFIAEAIILQSDACHCQVDREKSVTLQLHLIACVFRNFWHKQSTSSPFHPLVRWLILLSSAVVGVSVSSSIGSISLTHSVRRSDATSLTICSSLPSREGWCISLMTVVYSRFIRCRYSNF
jgi:hypothetical protein